MGSFGYFDCCMNGNIILIIQFNDQGGGLAIKILQFNCCFDNEDGQRKDGLKQEGWHLFQSMNNL